MQPPGEEGGGTKCSPLAAPPPPASLRLRSAEWREVSPHGTLQSWGVSTIF